MAEENKEEGKEGGEAPAAKSPKSKKPLVIAIILILDLVLMGAMAMFIVHKMKGEDPVKEEQKKLEEEEKKKAEMITEMGATLEKPLDFTVNLADKEPHYLKTSINIEWDGVKFLLGKEAVEKRKPKIKDIIINILSAQTTEILMRPEGKQRAREDILHQINAIMPKEEVQLSNIYWNEFLIQ